MSPAVLVSLIWSIPATLAVVGYVFLQWNKQSEWKDYAKQVDATQARLTLAMSEIATDVRQLELKVKDLVKLPPKPKVY